MALAGQTALIFGGSSGMGKAAAVAILKAGGTPWIVGRDEGRLAAAKAEIEGSVEGKALAVKTSSVDASDEAAVAAFFGGVPSGSVNHLVVTLGAAAGCASVEGEEGFKGLKRQFDLKFFGQLMPASYGASKLADGGSIVFTSGALAERPGQGSTALGAANAALQAITIGMANDLGPRLRVNCVSPGLTDTEMWANMPPEKKAGMLKGFGATLPLKRAGLASDVGEAIRMLLEANYTTGHTLRVDGGASIRP